MLYKNSNLYASRVFSEHPLALWAIDEGFYFYSLLSEEAKKVASPNWTFTNTSDLTLFQAPSQNPIQGSPVSALYLSGSVSASTSVYSPEVSYETQIDDEKGSACANAYIYIPSSTVVEKVQIGIATKETSSPDTYSYSFKEHTSLKSDMWEKIEYTKDLSQNKNIKMFINIVYNDLVQNTPESSTIYLAGLSLGQWSEPFNSVDTGIISSSVPTNIKDMIGNSGDLKGVPLDPYGFVDSDLAYAIEHDKRLLAETSGIPMVYGSKNNVSILYRKSIPTFSEILNGGTPDSSYEIFIDGGSPSGTSTASVDGGFYNYIDAGLNPAIPSLVFPSKGFLNQSGIYSNLTVEFWMRLNNESVDPIRIMGPLTSEDGLYVGGEFITVKVGKYVKSYFIGQWYRPMLVHFGQSSDEIFLMINGEKVISINIDSLNIDTFPPKAEDYLGFYGDQKITPFDIDSFSIFPYKVNDQIAKRRFVYGQGVQNQDNIVLSFGGELTYFDFPYAGYNSTISFPDRTSWANGYYNNLKVNQAGLSLQEYTLPELIFSNSVNTISDGESNIIWSTFEEDNYLIQDENYDFISMVPNNTYNTLNSKIYFSTLNKTSYKTDSIFSILKADSDVTSRQSLLYFSKASTTDYFEVLVQSGSIQYIYNDEILYLESVSPLEYFSVGIDFSKASETYPNIETFFSNTDNMSLNFAGNLDSTFLGKIFSLTLNNKFFTDKDQIIGSTGLATKTFNQSMYSYIGAYTLKPKQSNSTIYFDVASTGYWESSIPLTYFAKYINNELGEKVYDLDLIQFNIDIPNTIYSKSNLASQDYNNNTKTKIYLTLQQKDNIGLTPYVDYTNTIDVGNDRVVDFNEVVDYENTKFSVCDSTVIFPPKNEVDFNDYYVGIHIELTSNGINTENILLKKMSFSGLSYNEGVEHNIKTPTGKNISPVTELDGTYSYKSKNPLIVENETSSYLYITGNHGLCSLPINSPTNDGIKFKINESLKPDFKMVGIQAYLMFNEDSMFENQHIIGRIVSESKTFDIVLFPEADKKRAFIKLIDSNNIEVPGLVFFINGKLTNNPVIKPLQWNSIVISLQDNSLNLNRTSASFEIYAGVRVNNFAAYTDINELSIRLSVANGWDDIVDGLWSSIGSLTWASVLSEELIPVTLISIDGEETFNTYSGLSYAVGDDNSILSTSFDSIQLLNDATWTNFDIKPI